MEGCNCVCFVYHGVSIDRCRGDSLADYIAIVWDMFTSYIKLLEEVKLKAEFLKYGAAAVAYFVPNTSISTVICASTLAGMATISVISMNYETLVACSAAPMSNGFMNAMWMIFEFFNTILSGIILAPVLLALNVLNIIMMCISKTISLLFFGLVILFQKFTGTSPQAEPTRDDIISALNKFISLVPMSNGEVRPPVSLANLYGASATSGFDEHQTSRPQDEEASPLLDRKMQTTSTSTSIEDFSESSNSPKTAAYYGGVDKHLQTPISAGVQHKKVRNSASTTVDQNLSGGKKSYSSLPRPQQSLFGTPMSGGSPDAVDTIDEELIDMFSTMKVGQPVTQDLLIGLINELMVVRTNRFCFIRCLRTHDQILFIHEMTRLLYLNNKNKPEVMVEAVSLGTMLMADWKYIMANIRKDLTAVYFVWRYAYWGESAGRLTVSDSKTMYMVLVDTIEGGKANGKDVNLLFAVGHIKKMDSFQIKRSTAENHKADEKLLWQETAF